MEDTFLTADEVARLVKVSRQTVYNWVDRGQLPATRIGPRRVRVRQSDLNAFIAAGSTTGAPDQASGPSASDWGRLEAALANSSAAVADDDHAGLAESLDALADSARGLAEALRGDAAEPRTTKRTARRQKVQ